MEKWTNRLPWLIGVAYWMLLIINGRFNLWDFQVYYGAAKDWIAGGDVYGQSYGLSSGFYKYSLTALIPFVPFTILPFFWAATIYYFTLLYFIIRFVKKWSKWLSCNKSRWSIISISLITLLFFGDHLERELFLGNINFLLLVLLMWFWHQVIHQKWKWAGWILAFVCLVKPHFIITIPLIVLLAQWSVLRYFSYGLIVLYLIPVCFIGPFDFIDLNTLWFKTMSTHNAALHESPNTIYGLLLPFFQSFAGHYSKLYILLILFAVGLFAMALWFYFKRFPNGQKNLLYFLIFALVPSLTHTDTEHFLFSVPLFLFILTSIEKNEKAGWIYMFLVFSVIPFLLNSPDIFGKAFSKKLDEGGLGWANLILISIFFVRVIQGIKNNKAYIRLER